MNYTTKQINRTSLLVIRQYMFDNLTSQEKLFQFGEFDLEVTASVGYKGLKKYLGGDKGEIINDYDYNFIEVNSVTFYSDEKIIKLDSAKLYQLEKIINKL